MKDIEKLHTTIDGKPVSYTLKRSSRARHARLEISPEHGLVVVIPAHTSTGLAQRLLEEKRRWVFNKLNQYKSDSPAVHPIRDGDTILFMGGQITIEVVGSRYETICMDITRQRLLVFLPIEKDGLQPALEKWFRAEAEYRIGQMAEEQSQRMGLSYNRIVMKSQRTMWGSCSRKRNLNFNWRLLMAPEPVIEYVVVHELAHLSVMSHSRRFWQLVEKYCPDWREHRVWLRKHSVELNRELRG
jgi:predicted metal-dependent hydrolase